VTAADPAAPRGTVARLTEAGRATQRRSRDLLDVIDGRWTARFGPAVVDNLRTALESVVGEPDGQPSRVLEGLTPYPDGWRASVPAPGILPYFPVVLHRGGYPDGS
jgi:hypothetical protein